MIQKELTELKNNRAASIFSITERNEDSEMTGGGGGRTYSLLSHLLKADNEDALKS